jgi:dTDP-glucose pyrophosphorylase/thiamine kinase-like enzyme
MTLAAVTGKLPVSTLNNLTVVIPTAGLGSRVGKISAYLNKALVPINAEPMLSHIINRFPRNSKFIIVLGHLAGQVKDFCEIAYPELNIEYVYVDDWTSTKSGTAYSLSCCAAHITGPFWYVPCDTYFNENITENTNNDCFFVKQVPQEECYLYTIFNTHDNKIISTHYKPKESVESTLAFTGLMCISNWQNFLSLLATAGATEFVNVIQAGSGVRTLDSWSDIGTEQKYKAEQAKLSKFDFTKDDEITYCTNNKIIKWTKDASLAEKRHLKALANPIPFPTGCNHIGNFFKYDFVPGETLYQYNETKKINMPGLLTWLENNVWKEVDISNVLFLSQCNSFYKEKTLARIELFKQKCTVKQVLTVNGVSIQHYQDCLDNIDWDYLAKESVPRFVHGDLQFDNIVIDDNANFTLIDWRPDFSGAVTHGDLYYDLAKLAGGLMINYSKIKENSFSIVSDLHNVNITLPTLNNTEEYLEQLYEYVENRGLDSYKVKMLVPIIFWNMAPLHNPPFDIFLWYLGLKLFSELDSSKHEIYKPQ